MLVAGLLLGLPLLGLILAGRSIRPYLEFPPLTRYVVHEPFSWPAYVALALLILASIGLVRARIASTASRCVRPASHLTLPPLRATSFPWWGWSAVVWTVIWWTLAWTRFSWMEPLQPHTFTPLWLGYIVVVNAWTFTRTGRCMMLHRPRYFFPLFPLSAVFWWFFEYLNRFVQNWYYVGVTDLSPLEYFVRATISFSTVLPAVMGTAEWLSTFPYFAVRSDQVRPMMRVQGHVAGWIALCMASVGLGGIGLWPDYLFPLVWVAPTLIMVSLQDIRGEFQRLGASVKQNGGAMWQAALAALICGWFWEMWNFKSLAHWEYAVPFVQRFHVFEMPLLGYAGYLPFGLECLVMADACLTRKYSAGVAYYTEAERRP